MHYLDIRKEYPKLEIPVFENPEQERGFYLQLWKKKIDIRRHYKSLGFERFLYDNSLYFFIHDLMFTGKEQWRLSLTIHYKLCKFLEQKDNHYKLVLLFRRGMKSSILRSYIMWRLSRDKTLRFLYYCGRIDHAAKNLRNIARNMEGNKLYLKYYPEMTITPEHTKKKKWTRKDLEVPVVIELESELSIHNEANVEIGSIETGMSGQHYDEIVVDDPVTNVNVRTVKQRQEVKDALAELDNVLLDGGYLTGAGTRWHYDDAYGEMVNNVYDISEEGKKKYIYAVYHRKLVENGEITYPEVFDWDFIKMYIQKHGVYKYSCQFLCEPMNPDNAIFNVKNLRLIQKMDLDKITPVNTYVLIDTINFEKTDGRDRLAIVVMDIDKYSNIFIKRVVAGRYADIKLIKILNEMYELIKLDGRVNSYKFAMEEFGYENKYKKYIEQQVKNKLIGFKIYPIPRTTSISKAQKIAGSSLFVDNGQVFLVCKDGTEIQNINMDDRDLVQKILDPGLKEFYKEMEIYHPDTAEHDDIMDAFSGIKYFVLKAREKPVEKVYNKQWQCRWCQQICTDENAEACPACGNKLVQVPTEAAQAAQFFDQYIEQMQQNTRNGTTGLGNVMEGYGIWG